MKIGVVRIGAGILVGLLCIQLVPVDCSNPPADSELPAPVAVRTLLRRACYDCHSNRTRWPWYSRVAPISWMVASDVHEGRDEMNFSTWNGLAGRRRAKILHEIVEEVEEGEMPPWSYRWIHADARLTADDRGTLIAWARSDPLYGMRGEDEEPRDDD
jgi:hypothetical protein